MEGFILELDVYEILKVESNSVSLLLTLTWSISILFKKLTSEKHLLQTMPPGWRFQ